MSVYNLHKMNGEKLFKFNKKFSALFLKNPLQFPETSCIITNVVTLIAVKREVAAPTGRFFRGANVKLGNWRQVTVQDNSPRQAAASIKHLMSKSMAEKWKQRVIFRLRTGYTRESVQSPLVVLVLKVRKGGDFFYGKSGNENHIEGV